VSEHFAVMGAGEVGFYLARQLSQAGHNVVVIELDPEKGDRVQESLDAAVVLGNGSHVPVLEAARVDRCDLFMAVSSSDEANLAAAVLAKRLGARRTVVRVNVAEDVTVHRRVYEEAFAADLLLSTQLLATTSILNILLGHNTLEVEYLAQGKIELRRIHLERRSLLTKKPLAEVQMPSGSLVVAFFRGEKLIVPSGSDRARPGDDALILCRSEVIDRVERMLSTKPRTIGTVVIVGAGITGYNVARALVGEVDRVKVIEHDRRRAEAFAARFPQIQVLHGDATDIALLRAERVDSARSFLALTGNDESNLMASLLAQELKVPQVIALVQRTETSDLWRRLGHMEVVSPRRIAVQRIQSYIESGYSATLVSLQRGQAQVLERRLAAASPAAGVTLAEMQAPKGLIVGAVARGERVFVPRGKDRLEVGDSVILFVEAEHVPTANLIFPSLEPPGLHPARWRADARRQRS
jgi:trk system potassium uptake protein TrkA